MSKLEELKKFASDIFANASDKGAIENGVKIMGKIEDVEKEFGELENKNKELVSAYREVVKNTNFKGVKETLEEQIEGKKAPTLEEHLKEFMKTYKEN